MRTGSAGTQPARAAWVRAQPPTTVSLLLVLLLCLSVGNFLVTFLCFFLAGRSRASHPLSPMPQYGHAWAGVAQALLGRALSAACKCISARREKGRAGQTWPDLPFPCCTEPTAVLPAAEEVSVLQSQRKHPSERAVFTS